MAWEWSHSSEAYASAQRRVTRLTKRELLVILSEWQYHDREQLARQDEDSDGPTLADFNVSASVRRLSRDTLADLVWDRMEQYATCDNGGFNAYCCPDGCHTVSFD